MYLLFIINEVNETCWGPSLYIVRVKLTSMKAQVLTMYLKADCLVCRANCQSYLRAHPPGSVQAILPFPWVSGPCSFCFSAMGGLFLALAR